MPMIETVENPPPPAAPPAQRPPAAARRAALLAGTATVVLWASAFVGIRYAGRHFGPGPLALGRLFVGTLTLGGMWALFAWRAYARGSHRLITRPNRRDLGALVLCGVLWFGAYNVALNAAERRVDPGTAAMLVNVGPVLIAILAGIVLREGFPRRLFQGLPIAFAGAVVIGVATRTHGGGAAGTGVLLCLLAAALYAGGVVAQKPVLARLSALQVTFAACLVGTLVCLPFAPALARELTHAPAPSIAWLVYLGVFPTATAFSTWAYALSHNTAGRMGALTYLVPPLAVLMGWLGLGQSPPPAALLGGALCLAGVALTRRT